MATPASSTSSPNSSLRIRIIQEIFNDYNGIANEQALQQLDAALEDRCPIIVIEPRILAEKTCKWIKILNAVSTCSVSFGLCSVVGSVWSCPRWCAVAPISCVVVSICSYGFHRYGHVKRFTNVPDRFSLISKSFGFSAIVFLVNGYVSGGWFGWACLGCLSGGFYLLNWFSFSPDPCSKYQIENDDVDLEKIYKEINNQQLPGNNSLVVLVLKEDKFWQPISDVVIGAVLVTPLLKAAFDYFL